MLCKGIVLHSTTILNKAPETKHNIGFVVFCVTSMLICGVYFIKIMSGIRSIILRRSRNLSQEYYCETHFSAQQFKTSPTSRFSSENADTCRSPYHKSAPCYIAFAYCCIIFTIGRMVCLWMIKNIHGSNGCSSDGNSIRWRKKAWPSPVILLYFLSWHINRYSGVELDILLQNGLGQLLYEIR